MMVLPLLQGVQVLPGRRRMLIVFAIETVATSMNRSRPSGVRAMWRGQGL